MYTTTSALPAPKADPARLTVDRLRDDVLRDAEAVDPYDQLDAPAGSLKLRLGSPDAEHTLICFLPSSLWNTGCWSATFAPAGISRGSCHIPHSRETTSERKPQP